jgi:hypothetical protein
MTVEILPSWIRHSGLSVGKSSVIFPALVSAFALEERTAPW